MAQAQTVDVSHIIDERGVTAFNIRLVIFAFFIVLTDGYDITAMGFAAPSLIRDWGITDQSALGPVLGASLIGMLFGAPVLGMIGVRFGRKKAIIGSCLIFGVFTWLAVLATSLPQLFGLRLIAGIGIGGLLPNIIALTAEFAPRRYRATMIIVMFSGVSFGGAIPGAVSALLVPSHGWPILFTVGGVIPVAVALACMIGLPESIKYLVVRKDRARVARLLKSLEHTGEFPANVDFVIRDEIQHPGVSPKYLFRDGLALITPLLWLLFVLNLMGYFFLVSWTPVLLSSANIPLGKAALAQSLFQFGGAVGGWILCRPMDTKGLTPVAILFTIAIPTVALIGYLGTISEPLLMIAEFFAGFCVLGGQFALNAFSALIYPTSFRSKGAGWALGVGRIGSIVGPILGGVLIATHMPVQQLYLIAAIPFAVGAAVCFVLARLHFRRFQGSGMGQRETFERNAAGNG